MPRRPRPTSGGGRDGRDITQWLLDTDSLEDFLQTPADASLESSRAQGAGLTPQRDGRPLTVVSSGTAAPELDEKQYGQDDGPCHSPLRRPVPSLWPSASPTPRNSPVSCKTP
ncbi:hypothetical protein GCM10022420_059960 [Streptomyces iranensis]